MHTQAKRGGIAVSGHHLNKCPFLTNKKQNAIYSKHVAMALFTFGRAIVTNLTKKTGEEMIDQRNR